MRARLYFLATTSLQGRLWQHVTEAKPKWIARVSYFISTRKLRSPRRQINVRKPQYTRQTADDNGDGGSVNCRGSGGDVDENDDGDNDVDEDDSKGPGSGDCGTPNPQSPLFFSFSSTHYCSLGPVDAAHAGRHEANTLVPSYNVGRRPLPCTYGLASIDARAVLR